MSGVFGVVDPRRRVEASALMDEMAACLSHREWYVAERFVSPERNFALGRIGIGIFNPGPQPVWNASRTVALVMAGEIYKVDGADSPDGLTAPEQAALRLYEAKGAEFASHLNGAFVIAVWDQPGQRIVIANDRFGLYPLFYAFHDGRLMFAPEMKGILCDRSFPRRLDLTALAEYMRFQHLLGERTFFEGIQLLPNASTLVYDLPSGVCDLKTGWTFADIPYGADVRFDEAVEETARLLRRAVERMSGDRYRPGVFLSGGLDSRTLLGLVRKRPVASLTFGVKDCRDVYYAERIARSVGSEHHWVDLPDGNWVKEQVDFHLALTEGLQSWIHGHGISALPLVRQVMDVNLTGWDGATIVGGFPDSWALLEADAAALATRAFQLFTQLYTWPSLTEAEEQMLYCEPLRGQMQGRAFDSLRANLSRFLHYHPDLRGDYFYLRNHCGRLTQNMVTVARSHIEVRCPFWDYELFEFIYSLPISRRYFNTLYRAVIQRETPQLAYIPYDHDELLPTTRSWIRNAHALAVRIKRRVNRHLWPVFPERQTLYADYENYLRCELREWAEGILYDRRTAERGIFDPGFVRTLMQRHLSGREEWTIGKIAPIITYEMMLRQLYD